VYTADQHHIAEMVDDDQWSLGKFSKPVTVGRVNVTMSSLVMTCIN
jgi:hypothetical protein